ncbi:P-loop containing nucleoside triphosphate hydrolase protein [Earliella scabrosa]|nr:P-loop containing nucleoside triphosphate hydrolase protein [Earliella scabrosa]
MKKFLKEVQNDNVFAALNYDEQRLERMARDLSTDGTHSLDQYYTKMLYEWASLPEGRKALEDVVPPDVVGRMDALFHAADLSHIGWEYATTRRMPKRKFIMHVGPTNSGKTHNALRALAAAKRGMYAGPLRLLAYEIYDRLNKGQIIPLGAEPDPEAEPDPQTNIDLGVGPGKKKQVVVTKTANPKYARQCNMITGEEQKIVSPEAPLLSCTVEMTPFSTDWDVAVIDEIQLIADRQRGGAWTAALVGISAKEIHLCGEEAAVPLVEAIVRDLGDTVEINRYQRLTPLVVADKSLEGDLGNVRKGDCAVTFSRTGLFELKRRIETATRLRCALAYGRLPPEIRSEQAALFNDPKSDYHVLVGSDAVGMGLNLKIKRVIFETVSKFDGGSLRPLSVSQIKQIAGRAGRYGLHQKDSVGVVTTLHPGDLDLVRQALKSSSPPLQHARLQMNYQSFSKIVRALPWECSGATIAEAYHYVSKMPPLFDFQGIVDLALAFKFIDGYVDTLTLQTRLLLQNAPCPWRDNFSVAGAKSLMDLYRDHFAVSIEKMLHRSKLLKNLNKVLVLMEGELPLPSHAEIVTLLSQLETVHKVVVLYLWFTYRHAVAFPDQAKAFQLRHLTELAMDWCLEAMQQMRVKAPQPAIAARNAVLKRRPLARPEPTEGKVDEQVRVTDPEQYTFLTRERLRSEVFTVSIVR